MSGDFACRLSLDRIRDGERIDLVADADLSETVGCFHAALSGGSFN